MTINSIDIFENMSTIAESKMKRFKSYLFPSQQRACWLLRCTASWSTPVTRSSGGWSPPRKSRKIIPTSLREALLQGPGEALAGTIEALLQGPGEVMAGTIEALLQGPGEALAGTIEALLQGPCEALAGTIEALLQGPGEALAGTRGSPAGSKIGAGRYERHSSNRFYI